MIHVGALAMSLTLFGSAALLAGSPQAQLLSIHLEPQNATLWGTKASQRFLVLGKCGDGLSRDVTSQSRFSVSNPRVATVDETGRVIARADGEIVLTARIGDQIAKTKVQIKGSREERPSQFDRDIVGIFTKRGCNSSDCHGSVKGKADSNFP